MAVVYVERGIRLFHLPFIPCTRKVATGVVGYTPSRSKLPYATDEVDKLSELQRKLRMDLNSTPNMNRRNELRVQRNRVQKEIRILSRQLALQHLESRIREVESLKNGPMMFAAIKLLKPKCPRDLTIVDNNGKAVLGPGEQADRIAEHYTGKFSPTAAEPAVTPFTGTPKPQASLGDGVLIALPKPGTPKGPHEQFASDNIADYCQKNLVSHHT